MTESFANSPLAQIDLLQLLAAANSAVTEGNPTAAIALYRAWIAVHLDHPLLHAVLFNLAVLTTPTDPQQAMALYRKLLVLNPNDANVLFNLGLLLRQTGQPSAANTEIAAALKINPSLASRLPASTTTTPAAPGKP